MNADRSESAQPIVISTPISSPQIWDMDFARAHTRLIRLCDHVYEVSSSFDANVLKAAQIGDIRTLPFSAIPGSGRRATDAEWIEVGARSLTIWSAFSEVQRKRFITTQVPGWFSYLLSAFLLLAIASVFAAFLIRTEYWTAVPGNLLVPFLIFVISLGAIGAAASIGMNALSLQDDASFDISKGKFLWLRLLLGALFGVILTISWSFPVFQTFISALQANPPERSDISPDQLKQALWLITPFVLGFSTSLVILVLSRAVESIQTFFGKPPTSSPGKT